MDGEDKGRGRASCSGCIGIGFVFGEGDEVGVEGCFVEVENKFYFLF